MSKMAICNGFVVIVVPLYHDFTKNTTFWGPKIDQKMTHFWHVFGDPGWTDLDRRDLEAFWSILDRFWIGPKKGGSKNDAKIVQKWSI